MIGTSCCWTVVATTGTAGVPLSPTPQTRLERLIHDAAFSGEIVLAAPHKVAKWNGFRNAAPPCMQDASDRGLAGAPRYKFDLPDALASVAAVLL